MSKRGDGGGIAMATSLLGVYDAYDSKKIMETICAVGFISGMSGDIYMRSSGECRYDE